MRQSRLCDKKRFFACGALDEVTFSLIFLNDSLLALTHMVKCALIWCRFLLQLRSCCFSVSSFRFFLASLAGGEGFSFSFTMGFPFLSIFLRCSHGRRVVGSGMGNDWWIREKREKSFTCSRRFIIVCFFSPFHMKRRPSVLKTSGFSAFMQYFFPFNRKRRLSEWKKEIRKDKKKRRNTHEHYKKRKFYAAAIKRYLSCVPLRWREGEVLPGCKFILDYLLCFLASLPSSEKKVLQFFLKENSGKFNTFYSVYEGGAWNEELCYEPHGRSLLSHGLMEETWRWKLNLKIVNINKRLSKCLR